MKIKYMGTAAAEGWPALFCNCESCQRAKALGGKNIRTRSQALIDDTLLVDFPPDTYLHMLRDGLDLPHIHHLLITHTHQDHLILSDIMLRSEWFANDMDGVLTVYGNDALHEQFHAFVADASYGATIAKGVRCEHILPFETYSIGDHQVTPLLALHDRSEKCYLYLIQSGDKTLLYGNDTGIFPKETWDYLQGKHLDLVSLDCTMLMHKEGTNHMGIEDILEVQKRLLDMGCACDKTEFVITHFSHNGKLLHHEVEARVSPYGVKVAYDGFEIEC